MKQNNPPWLDHGSIDEIIFCQEFLQDHPMICVNDAFFTVEGRTYVAKAHTSLMEPRVKNSYLFLQKLIALAFSL